MLGVVFYHCPSWRGRILRWAQRAPFDHVGLLNVETHELIEAKSSGVRCSSFWEANPDCRVQTVPLQATPEEAEAAWRWAKREVGMQYGFVGAFFAGLRATLGLRVIIEIPNQLYCTELVAYALAILGQPLPKGILGVTTRDLAQALGILAAE